MAKRELSNTLRNLKFMQRAAQREEKPKKEEDVKPDGNFFSPGAVNKKCVVIMEGDPLPGATMGRMSFQSFNPSIDKLNEAGNTHKPEAPATSSDNQSGKFSFRENGPSNGAECPNVDDKLNYEADGDLKRKQPEEVSEKDLPNESPKTVVGGQHSSPLNNKASFKQPKREKLDWNVLRPSKGKNRRE
ncbi:hypothetical protein HS088_TW22G01067 [Tripterygium wilfordii]|uniref:M-phase phosphoprotein 6 n=1 Tax=Tripterygium wilfordii TaxID=458696 RepID=A0A7J7BZR8_TRIWF|nr:uncharacterized protein LOC119990849 [Tripterygium wilfordii]KAF5727374.1 hypothetical protein HS088_TW22G01067 [Tripterygium wilfordii]